jgi:dTDP-4-amino-4,6-dideoxygalactose transaminase
VNAYGVVAEFERRVAEFAGARHAVAVDCCSNALFLACKYVGVREVILPARTYISVPFAVIHAGGTVRFSDYNWLGTYELAPYAITDGAKRFRRGMYAGGLHCLSFHAKKHVPIGRGGMVLTDDEKAANWLRRARYDGREGKAYADELVDMVGWHAYMTPEQAARGLALLDVLPSDALPDLTEDYPDLRRMPVFMADAAHRIAA